ncbi:class I SAM-dependent methyltransferase [Novacetimonas cocois]|uniref:SAM-dependent methyltransferase n=1 Tax=Novacetimonas cocois TaxID=1747507 RepID=A0A365YZF5_9PROT|nr:class I SAM-dependent methyltransferase [Novacetimonas cocois]RBM08810.1 SAM-dependent methyltransferase [Novacetimonas cocois]
MENVVHSPLRDKSQLYSAIPHSAIGACRLCATPLQRSVVDLGLSPLANSFIKPELQNSMEAFYPLHAFICEKCFLVQLSEFESPQSIFGDYIYFSSYSESWLQHAKNYVKKQIDRFGLDGKSLVVEVASNDGYLLQYVKEAGIRTLGVEPAANVAEIAVSKGIATEVSFFGAQTATRLKSEGYVADMMVANNVVAHVPDLHDFLEGFRILLAPQGIVTFEFPHLLRLIKEYQFDTIYHEHFSYLSLQVIRRALAAHGLRVFDVEQLPTHGGSLRVFATHRDNAEQQESPAVEMICTEEKEFGLENFATYENFARTVIDIKCGLLDFLITSHRNGKVVVGYGAPAKGNTLLNYCGVGPELIPFTTDASPYKQNMLLPGTRIPVLSPEAIREQKPDFVLILPWNLKNEIVGSLSYIREWGGKFVIPIPQVEIF